MPAGTECRQHVLMCLGPVDHADRVGGLWILRIGGQNLLLPFLGIVQLLDLEINAGDLLQAVDIVRDPWTRTSWKMSMA